MVCGCWGSRGPSLASSPSLAPLPAAYGKQGRRWWLCVGLHICQVKACFGFLEPSYSSVAFYSIRPQMTWLFSFVCFRKYILVQRDSACENGFWWINQSGFPSSESFTPFALHGMYKRKCSPVLLVLSKFLSLSNHHLLHSHNLAS